MAKLPQSTHLLHPITIPSTGKTHMFRQFLVREEKMLLTASQTNDKTEILRAIEQLIVNCASDDFNVSELSTFDFDYVFIKLRAISVNNTVEVKYTDEDSGEEFEFKIDLNKIVVDMPNVTNKVKTKNDITIKLRYPSMREMLTIIDTVREGTEQGIAVEYLDLLLARCIDSIYSDEEVYDQFSDQQLLEWIDDQETVVYEQIKEFLTSIPEVSHTVSFSTSEGEQRELVLRGIDDFFTWQ